MLRIALFLVSLVNVAVGLGLAGAYVKFSNPEEVPTVVLLIGTALFVQGAFTIGYLQGWWSRIGERATQLFVAGESAGALVGILGTIQGILYNLHPVNGDQEFGPLMVAIMAGTHAGLGLIYAARNERFTVRGRA